MFQKTIKAINQKEIVVKSTIVSAIATLLLMFLFTNNVLAAGWASPTPPTGAPESFDDAIINLTNWVLGFVAMIAVLAIVWGGVMYIASSGDETKATTGKRIVTYALIGLVIAGIAYALVNVIITEILVTAPAAE